MLKSLWNKPTETFEKILTRNFRWPIILGLFAVNGIYVMYYLLRSAGLLDLSSNMELAKAISAIVLFGVIWGIFFNLLVGFFVKLTGRLFKATGDLKKIYTVMAWASAPLTIGSCIIILNLVFGRIIFSEGETTTLKIFLSFLILILSFCLSILAIWQLVLLFKGLKVAQNLNWVKTILNYILATLLYSPIYYLLIELDY